jgi:SEC-C motif domain protein
MQCPCRSVLDYEKCCGPYHAGLAAPSPLTLMRSRYSGYALKKIDYIIATTHPILQQHPFAKWKQEIALFCDQTSFDGLDILEVIEGAEEGFVTFKAHLSQQGKDCSFTEKSRFEKKDGKWFYHSALSVKRE